MHAQEKIFIVKGRKISAKCWHDESLPPLLALHGWQDNAATFDRIAPLLAQFHIVAMDFAGHGLSDWRAEGMRYHTLDHVDDVLAVVNALGWEKFRLMGHSMGAGMGVLLAGALPERVQQMVLIDGLGPYGSEPAQAPQILREALMEWSSYAPRSERVFENMALAVEARRRGFTPLSEQAASILCSRGVKEVSGGLSWSMDRRVRHHSSLRMSEAQTHAFLAEITAPILLLRAKNNGFPGAAEFFAKRWLAVKNGTLKVLPGGHHLHLDDCPERVAQEVVAFFGG